MHPDVLQHTAHFIALLGAFFIPSGVLGQALSQTPLTIPMAYEHVLHSTVNGREYRISVALPFSYDEGSPADTTRYSVIDLLDGDMALPLVAPMFRLTNQGPAGNVILVGVGYPPGADPGVPARSPTGVFYRLTDYTPPAYPPDDSANAALLGEWPGAGRAPEFLRVLKEEVIPLIDSRYRTTNQRGIHGHSFGGLFAAYVLFEDPDLFTHYAITSPSLWWDNSSIFLREPAFARSRTSLPKKVYLSIGENESALMTAVMWRMVERLGAGIENGHFTGLELFAETVWDEEHATSAAFNRALRALYPPSPFLIIRARRE